jgi:hypothetical protein
MTQRGTRSAVQDPQHEQTDLMCVFRCASPNTQCASRSCVPPQLQTRYGLSDRTYPQNADETLARHGQHGRGGHARIRTVLRELHGLTFTNLRPATLASRHQRISILSTRC